MNMGYDPHHVLTMRLALVSSEHNSWPSRMEYISALRERLSTIPGVTAVSIDEVMPTGGGWQMEYGLPGDHYGADMDIKMPRTDMEFVDDRYFATVRILLLAGRIFTESEYKRGESVALVSSSFAHQQFGAANPVGQLLRVPPLVAGYPGVLRPAAP
jgi:hypothetical protein